MKIAIIGAGAMGLTTQRQALKNKRISKVYVIDPLKGENLFYLDHMGEKIDGIIDFSHPDNLTMIKAYLSERKEPIPLVIGTTGYSQQQRQIIKSLSEDFPLMESSNYSYGINVIKNVGAKMSKLLGTRCDIGISEKHHRLKKDAPSGTALTLAEALSVDTENIQSFRGGTIAGEHEITFAMEDEVIELKHSASSKNIFANGAIEAVLWLNGKEPGLYSVDEMLFN